MSSYRRYITENSSKEARITLVIPVATRYLPASGRRKQSEYDEKSRILDAIVAPKHRNTAPIKRATLLRVAPPRLSYLFLHLIFLHLVFVSLLAHRVFLRFMVASFGRVSFGHVLAVFRLAIPRGRLLCGAARGRVVQGLLRLGADWNSVQSWVRLR